MFSTTQSSTFPTQKSDNAHKQFCLKEIKNPPSTSNLVFCNNVKYWHVSKMSLNHLVMLVSKSQPSTLLS